MHEQNLSLACKQIFVNKRKLTVLAASENSVIHLQMWRKLMP